MGGRSTVTLVSELTTRPSSKSGVVIGLILLPTWDEKTDLYEPKTNKKEQYECCSHECAMRFYRSKNTKLHCYSECYQSDPPPPKNKKPAPLNDGGPSRSLNIGGIFAICEGD
jgi:hypothetical protein